LAKARSETARQRRAASKLREFEAASELIPGSVNLSMAIWGLVKREAETQNRSESYILREILGEHFGLSVELSNPPPKRRETQGENRG